MTKVKTIFECTNCGSQFPAWTGRCNQCGHWNTVEKAEGLVGSAGSGGGGKEQSENQLTGHSVIKLTKFSAIKSKNFKKLVSGINEFDRVLGGGIVPGSLVLIGGDPGIGKSTLALQIANVIAEKIAGAANLGMRSRDVIYLSGEESLDQVKLRADRLGISSKYLNVVSESNIDLVASLMEKKKPALMVIDSIQTMWSREAAGSPGSVSQVKMSAGKIMEKAKLYGIAAIFIGHVTKDGVVAGPKTLEHLVDTVLYLEGDRYHTYRVLRGVKNRFGGTNEAGVFEMVENGMREVKNPSALFLGERRENATGSVVAAVLEGTRAFLVEIQALTSTTIFGYPKRTVSGIDFNRLSLLIAVLTKRAKLNLGNQDVYVNVVGGFKIDEPAVDLAICAAIASAFRNKPIDARTAFTGEVGLSGEVRQVSEVEKRVNEAEKLGFQRIVVPRGSKIGKTKIKVYQASTVFDALRAAVS